MQWTYENPGAGTVAVFETVKTWLVDTKTGLSDAWDDLDTVVKSLEQAWTGSGANAFSGEIGRCMKALRETEDAVAVVETATGAYVSTVEEIKNEARKSIEDRNAAHMILSKTDLDSSANPPSADEVARRQREYDDALVDFSDAVGKLDGLAEQREAADRAFAGTVMEEMSVLWGDVSFQNYYGGNDAYRESANDTVWQLFDEFRSGEGNRTRFLDADEDFTKWLRQSGHVNEARLEIRDRIIAGTLGAGDVNFYNRSVSDNPMILLGDGVNVVSGGNAGNLPETFLGSYNLTYTVESIDQYGNATVTYRIENNTTIDSMTRIPGTNGKHIWPYEELIEENEQAGRWEKLHQTIVWTEIIEIPGYDYKGNVV